MFGMKLTDLVQAQHSSWTDTKQGILYHDRFTVECPLPSPFYSIISLRMPPEILSSSCAASLYCCLCSVTDLKMASAVFVLPHPEKTARGGEDWYFIADNNRAIGIADGVGGWVSALCW